MSLSAMIFVLFPLFLIPSIILPSNRMKVFCIASLFAGLPTLVLFLAALLSPGDILLLTLGDALSPFVSFLFLSGMTHYERSLIGLAFLCLLLYFLLTIVTLLIQKAFVLGSNVTIRLGPHPIAHFIYAFFFLLFTYGMLVLFLITIRQILPLPEGFLSPLFQSLLPLEA